MNNQPDIGTNSFTIEDEGSINLEGNIDTLIQKVNDYLNELSEGNKEKKIYLNIRCFSTY